MNHWILTNEGNEFYQKGRKNGGKRKGKGREKGRESDISIQYKTIMTLIGSIINAT